MIQASSVTLPSLSGKPPLPTDCPFSLASSTLQPSSTASRALPPDSITSIAFAVASITCQVATTTGKTALDSGFSFEGIDLSSTWSLHEVIAVPTAKPTPVSDAFFKNFLRFMFYYFSKPRLVCPILF